MAEYLESISLATSLFVLTITAFAAGLFQHGVRRTMALSIGAIAGANSLQEFRRTSAAIGSSAASRSLSARSDSGLRCPSKPNE